MARKKKDELAVWEKEMEEQAAIAAAQEDASAGGQFFSTRGGQLSFNDAPLPGNEVAVVVLDAILENVYYTGKFDPDAMEGPACFAFGRDLKEMKPHELASEPQHETCEGCPRNEWGSADTGRGKACANRRRLALIPAGVINERTGEFTPEEDPEHYKTAQIAYLKLPVTSVRAYTALVKQVAGVMKRPLHGMYTRIKVVPDQKTQFKVVCEALGKLPNKLIPVIMDRHKEAQASIDFPYQPMESEAVPTKKRGPAKKKRKY